MNFITAFSAYWLDYPAKFGMLNSFWVINSCMSKIRVLEALSNSWICLSSCCSWKCKVEILVMENVASVSEQCFTSPPTQYRLSGRQFYRWTSVRLALHVLATVCHFAKSWICPTCWYQTDYTVWTDDWLSMVLRLRQHNIGYTADGFYRSDDPTNSVKALKEGG